MPENVVEAPPEMTDDIRRIAERLLELIDTRKGDNWWDPCCSDCYHEPWHHERFGPGVGVVVGEDTWKAAVPKCSCVCHEARRALGIEDIIHDERWQERPNA